MQARETMEEPGEPGLLNRDGQGGPVGRKTQANRHLRPVSGWSAADVVAEFRTRVEEQVPELRGYVTGKKNVIMLATTRKRLNTTPELEIALMDIFLSEDREVRAITRRPDMAVRNWLVTWPKNMNRARELRRIAPLGHDESHVVRSVLASDGVTEFPDTTLGRKRLAWFEDHFSDEVAQ